MHVKNGRVTKIEGDERAVSVSYEGLMENLAPGDRILVNNGLVIFEVEAVEGTEARCRTVVGGVLTNRKSMSFPGKVMPHEFLSEQDKADLLFGIQNEVDFVAASFVSRKQDLLDVFSESEMQTDDDGSVRIYIGRENLVKTMDNSTLVYKPIKRDGILVGAIGVIGPTRMNYSRVIAMIDHLSSGVSNLIEEGDERSD